MKKIRLTPAAIIAALPPENSLLADDDTFHEAVEVAIASGLTNPEKAMIYATAWRESLLLSRKNPAGAPPDPAPLPNIAAARQQAEHEGALAERTRLRAILTNPAATSRRDAAKHLAFSTNLTASEAIALLAATPPEPPAQVLQSLPPEIEALRACNSPTGLIHCDSVTGEAFLPTADSPVLSFIPYNPVDEAKKADPKYRAKEAWKRTINKLNADQAAPEQPKRG